MIITYHNLQFFRIQLGDTVIAFNPISKDSKFKSSRFGADIALITQNSPDFNGVDNLNSKNKDLFVISGPGEYEISGVFIKGVLLNDFIKDTSKINTAYSLVLDGISIGFLGSAKNKDISEKAKLALVDSDIVFVPIGGGDVMDFSDAHSLATKLGAKIIIPMHYGVTGEKDALTKFLKEGSSEKVEVIDKLTIKKKDLEGKNGEIVVLAPAS